MSWQGSFTHVDGNSTPECPQEDLPGSVVSLNGPTKCNEEGLGYTEGLLRSSGHGEPSVSSREQQTPLEEVLPSEAATAVKLFQQQQNAKGKHSSQIKSFDQRLRDCHHDVDEACRQEAAVLLICRDEMVNSDGHWKQHQGDPYEKLSLHQFLSISRHISESTCLNFPLGRFAKCQ
eukprot:gb/GECG01009905.1/.p1 GENE.gb/GECG01009905.1/~~gb/GECG01009905.1/.p1  ORF type:complete len:176 (+),score=25.46 gb/GECG01009905.1/:1-528(+)